eukprot:TRINITY_DN16265_c0_g1_i1.p1 TRINITY_DN16265_c0_g1~~TRINITY_DN16265_c0_g1_i1.p1  ORF type:complete len:731 (-),score=110.78 TRINITY_DN16265_c0_g1_i1:288-2414(-)
MFLSAVFCSLLSAPLLAGSVEESSCAHGGGDEASWLQKQTGAGRGNLNRTDKNHETWGTSAAVKSAPEVNYQCTRDTGGTCTFASCSSKRGPVDCKRGICECKPGYCNSMGVCTKEKEQPKCRTETDITCRFMGCHEQWGPTTCGYVGYTRTCICKPGYCNIHGFCLRSVGKVVAQVSSVTKAHPVFPKGHTGIKTALVVSGGGARATSFSAGVLRALEHMGLMKNVDALSSVSGGTWAASIYMFAKMDAKELLGKETSPSSLSMQALQQPPAPLIAAVTNEHTPIARQLLRDGIEYPQLWVKSVAKAILAPFGLDAADSYMAADEASVKRIKAHNPELKDATFLTPAKDRPKTFVMGGAILAPVGYTATKGNVVDLQMSPDYIGSPFYPDDDHVTYPSQTGRGNTEHLAIVGGGLVESFAFGGQEPEKGQDGGSSVTMPAPTEPFSLSKAVGVSSSGVSSALTQLSVFKGTLAALSPQVDYWPVTSKHLPGPQPARTYTLGDGGNLDNSGLLAMLQRRANHIIYLINTGSPLPPRETTDFCSMNDSIPADIGKTLENQLQAEFGLWKVDDFGEFLSRNQVFKTETLPPLLCELQKLKTAGKPAVARKRMKIQKNTWWGIDGGWDADIIFVYLDKSSDFESQLPADTVADLQKGSWGSFAYFPHYLPAFQNTGEGTALTGAQVNLLAPLGEYYVRENADMFRSLLHGR